MIKARTQYEVKAERRHLEIMWFGLYVWQLFWGASLRQAWALHLHGQVEDQDLYIGMLFMDDSPGILQMSR